MEEPTNARVTKDLPKGGASRHANYRARMSEPQKLANRLANRMGNNACKPDVTSKVLSAVPPGRFAVIVVLYGDAPEINTRYVLGAARLAANLYPPWALWVVATHGILSSPMGQQLASLYNVHCVKLVGCGDAVQAAGRTVITTFNATLARFVMLDDPSLVIGIVADADVLDGRVEVKALTEQAYNVATGARASAGGCDWGVHQYPVVKPRGGSPGHRVIDTDRISWNAGGLVQVRMATLTPATQPSWAARIGSFLADEAEAGVVAQYGVDEHFLTSSHSPLVRSAADGSGSLEVGGTVSVLETAKSNGGTLVGRTKRKWSRSEDSMGNSENGNPFTSGHRDGQACRRDANTRQCDQLGTSPSLLDGPAYHTAGCQLASARDPGT